MKTISNAESALLGLLSEEPMHPYKIEQEVKFRDMRFWTELSMSSIYKLLRKLEKDGLVERENRISPENRLQKLYSISKEGTECLKHKIATLLSSSEHIRWQVDIGIYNCNLLPLKKIRESLNEYRNDLLEKIKGYENLLEFLKDADCPQHRFEVAKRPVYLLKAEIAWVDSYIKNLKK
jgi:DNA-binding PadR family transcriptional regulator